MEFVKKGRSHKYGMPSINFPHYNSIAFTRTSVADLREVDVADIIDGMLCFVAGQVRLDDGLGGIYVYDPASVDADDSLDVVAPEGVSVGRWKRIVSNRVSDPTVTDFAQPATGAVTRQLKAKAREAVSITDFGASPDASATVNTAAIHAAMSYLLDRFSAEESYYAGGPADPFDFYAVNRQTGKIHIPAGRFKVSPNVFSSLAHPRSPYVGFEIVGDGKMSSILLLETGGSEAWFYNNTSANPNQFQQMHWKDIGFRSDNWRYGNVCKMWSAGGPKQPRWTDCDFTYLQKFFHSEGTGNADLVKVTRCTGHFYGDLLTLDNDQSVQIDFLGTDFGSYGHFIRVKQHGGGNVTFANASMDLTWHETYSPVGGNFMFVHDADASIGNGNCTYKFENCRVEVEAYKTAIGAPPFGIVKTVENQNALPRVVFDNINFVNGQTYTLDGAGNAISPEFRRVTAFQMWPAKHVDVRNCVLLKNFFYTFSGSRDTNSPNGGGIVNIENCYDGILGELPAADSALVNIHSRVTYAGAAGRLITSGMMEHTTGSSFVRKVLDADPRWQYSFGREPASTKKIVHFKHTSNGLPSGVNGSNDHYLDVPPGLTALRLFVQKAASGADTNTYQLHLKTNDRSGTLLGSSTSAQFKDLHVIDLPHVDLTGINRICLCASGTWDNFANGGIAYIEYV